MRKLFMLDFSDKGGKEEGLLLEAEDDGVLRE